MKIANENYILKGNISIVPGGNLTLVNSTLVFEKAGNSSFGIFIEPGGEFHTTDLDDDPATTADFSIIKSNTSSGVPGQNFEIHAMPNSTISFERTFIYQSKIIIESSRNLISNCVIADSDDAVIFKNSTYNIIRNSLIDNITGTGITDSNSSELNIRDVYINNCSTGIKLDNSVNVWFTDISIINSKIGILAESSSGKLIQSSIYINNCSTGIKLDNSVNAWFTDISIINSKIGILAESSSGKLIQSSIQNTDMDLSMINCEFEILNPVGFASPKAQLFSSSNVSIIDIEPLHGPVSDFWDNFILDNSSELHVINLIQIMITRDNYVIFPATHNLTVISTANQIVFRKILNSNFYSMELEPIKFKGSEMIVSDPYTIIYNDSGNFLNETFSIFENTSFKFHLKSNRAPKLRNSSVTPDSGDEKTRFVFEVEYLDLDGDRPQYVNLVLENDTYEMTAVDDASVPLSGIKYRFEFLSLTAGHLKYHYETDDGRGFGNSHVLLTPGPGLDVDSPDSGGDSDKEDSGAFFTTFIFICFTMVFVFVIFMIVMNYLMQKKVKKMGGVEPGTLPEDLEGAVTKEKSECSECGAVIDADASRCPNCGEEFEGEEFQCPRCHKVVPDEAQVCKYCGNKFLSLEEEAKERKRVKEEKRKPTGEGKKFVDKFYCSECGAVVDESMGKCPGCGEVFEPEIEDEPPAKIPREEKRGAKGAPVDSDDENEEIDGGNEFICSVCGAIVKESSDRCPKCETEFE